MSILLSLLAQILHLGLMIVAAPTVAGIMDWIDARLSGRAGPSVLTPWRELVGLSRKTPILIESVSSISRIAPAVALGATLSVAALIPSFAVGMALSPLADVLVIVSLLTIARVAIALAALDSGSALPGLRQQGASALSVFAEPAMMLAVVTLALMGGSFNLDLIIGQQREGVLLPAAASAVALTALLALLLAEVSVTGDGTEVAFAGMDLAMLRMTRWLRRLILITLISALFLPIGIATVESRPLAWLMGLAVWAAKLAAFTLAVSVVQALVGRIPRHSLPDLVGVAALLALLALIMVLATAGTA